MSNPYQDAQNNRNRLNSIVSENEDAYAEVPDFMVNGESEQSNNNEVDVVDNDYNAEIEDIPDHVQEQVITNEIMPSALVNEVKGKVSSTGQYIIDELLRYVENMGPGKMVNTTTGCIYQKGLWNIYDVMFNRIDDASFNPLYTFVLEVFNQHKDGAMHEDRIYRFHDCMDLGDVQRTALKRLTNLMLTTRDSKTRSASVKQLRNWGYILEYGLTDTGKNRIRNYYEL